MITFRRFLYFVFSLLVLSGCNSFSFSPAKNTVKQTWDKDTGKMISYEASTQSPAPSALNTKEVEIEKLKAGQVPIIGEVEKRGVIGESGMNDMSFIGIVSNSYFTLYIIGGIMIAGGVAAGVFLKNITLAIGLALGGILVIAGGIFATEYAWLIIPVVIIGGIGYILYKSGAFTKILEALKGTVSSVEEAKKVLPADEERQFKNVLAVEQDDKTKQIIAQVKTKI
jgi:hypothetical protein